MQLKKKLEDLRVTATKLRTPYESTDKSTLHDITSQDMTDSVAKELKLPDLAPHVSQVHYWYNQSSSSIVVILFVPKKAAIFLRQTIKKLKRHGLRFKCQTNITSKSKINAFFALLVGKGCINF